MTSPEQSSSILTMTYIRNSWIIDGYADGHDILISYTNSTVTDLSYLIGAI